MSTNVETMRAAVACNTHDPLTHDVLADAYEEAGLVEEAATERRIAACLRDFDDLAQQTEALAQRLIDDDHTAYSLL